MANSLAFSSLSFTLSSIIYSKVTLRFVLFIYSFIVSINSFKGYALLIGIILLLRVSLGACKLMARFTWPSSFINFFIPGITPHVDMVICLEPISIPLPQFIIFTNLKTLS